METTTTYERPDGTAYEGRDVEIIERVRADLLSGRTLRLHAASDRSRRLGGPPINREGWARCVEVLGKMAGQSDAFAQLAQGILARGIPLYQTAGEAAARVYENAAETLATPYDDVIGRASPEPGRYRDHQHAWTLYQRVALSYYLAEATAVWDSGVPGVGWCIDAIARAERVHLPASHFTRVNVWNQ